jgi:hypothetical protein
MTASIAAAESDNQSSNNSNIPSMSQPLLDVCTECDSLFMQICELIRQKRQLSHEIANLKSDALFALSSVRHAAPRLQLDSTQYATRPMQAQRHVVMSQSDDAEQRMSVADVPQSTESNDDLNAINQIKTKSSSGIRQRVFTAHQSNKDQQIDRLIAQQSMTQKEKDDAQSIDDELADAPIVDLSSQPLKWFSPTTIPPSLCDAQQKFISLLKQSMQLANIEHQLATTSLEFEQLLQQKHVLIKNSKT